jgi:hypothetical protein
MADFILDPDSGAGMTKEGAGPQDFATPSAALRAKGFFGMTLRVNLGSFGFVLRGSRQEAIGISLVEKNTYSVFARSGFGFVLHF